MSFTQVLFSFNGRIGIGKFWQATLVHIILNIAIYVMAAAAAPTPPQDPNEYAIQGPSDTRIGVLIAIFVTLIVLFVSYLAVAVKRCHDRGKSGWWVLISFIPLVGFVWWLIDLGILEGQAGPNEYGPDPRAQTAASPQPAQDQYQGQSMTPVAVRLAASADSPGGISPDLAEDLRRLKALLDEGIISQEEFQERKSRLLS
jgi:uncharacterized membrane protein YhaH (DUF805 family)